MTGNHPTEALRTVLREPLATSGLDLEAVEVSTAGRRRVVRVLVDKDGGVTLDDLAAATTVVGEQLDGSDLLDDRPYTLEVTSPGTDRPLTEPRHWRRNVDRLVAITRRDGSGVTGRIRAARDDAAVLDVGSDGPGDGAGVGTALEVPYTEIAVARVQVEFNRRQPGERRHGEEQGQPSGEEV